MISVQRFDSGLAKIQLNRRSSVASASMSSFERDALREKPCQRETTNTAFVGLPAT